MCFLRLSWHWSADPCLFFIHSIYFKLLAGMDRGIIAAILFPRVQLILNLKAHSALKYESAQMLNLDTT